MEGASENDILERLKIATSSSTDVELSRKLGLSKQSIASARKNGRVPDSWVPKAAEMFHVSMDWLQWGIGEMRLPAPLTHLKKTGEALRLGNAATLSPLKDVFAPMQTLTELSRVTSLGLDGLARVQNDLTSSSEEPHEGSLQATEIHLNDVDLIMIPMVEARLSAGTGSLETSGECERSYAFRRDFIQRKGNPKHMVLMRVRGDSMQPEIMNNDVVLLDQGKTEIAPGPIFAVGFEDAIYLKRVDFLPGKIILKSVNPEYPPIELDVRGQVADLFRVIGQVLWVGREYR